MTRRVRLATLLVAFVLCTNVRGAHVLAAPEPPDSPAAESVENSQLAQLTAARERLLANLPLVQERAGHDVAFGLGVRLLADMDTVRDAAAGQPPPGYTVEQLNDHVAAIVRLDTKLADDIVTGSVEPPTTVRGLDERLMRANADGTLQPYAIYVPAGASARSPLIVLLHGFDQTEAELLSAPYWHQLADATGAIVVAPWGRGIYDYASPASDDVYQIAADIRAGFGLSPRRVFLVGYSMGGFAVYKLAPMHPETWAAVMSVSGAILSRETASVTYRLRGTPIYVVTGAKDTTVPASYGEETAAFLASAGLPASFYEERGGTHSLATLLPSLSIAWNDMLSGRVRQSEPPAGAGEVPASEPTGTAVKN